MSDTTHGGLMITVTADTTSPPPPPTAPGVPGLQEIASGLDIPVFLTSPPNDDRLFIVEKVGTIRVVEGGAMLPTPFLDIHDRVSGKTEQGLLGLAFAPDYATTGRFYVYYTDVQGDTRVSSFLVSSDRNHADASTEAVLLTQSQPGVSHKGGDLAFGPDGMLYISLGDGGSHDGMDDGHGQSLDDLLGAMLRIDVSSGTGYVVPPDNPFVSTPGARPEIWSYGFRNPWRYSFDRATGDLYIADVGESRWEEVNRARATEGDGRGLNYGWSLMEGDVCEQPGCDTTGLTLPTFEYGHDQGCAIVGGYVYRGSALPALAGQYIFGDYCAGLGPELPRGRRPGAADGLAGPEPRARHHSFRAGRGRRAVRDHGIGVRVQDGAALASAPGDGGRALRTDRRRHLGSHRRRVWPICPSEPSRCCAGARSRFARRDDGRRAPRRNRGMAPGPDTATPGCSVDWGN